MKSRMYTVAAIALGIATALPVVAQTTRFDSRPGALKMRIEGTSNIHNWQVEGKLIGGYIEVGKDFPTEAGKTVAPGKVDAKVEAFVPVRSLVSVEKDGSPYSTKMDEIMWEKLKVAECPKIFFRLTELTLKEAPKAKDQPYVFDSKGELAVGGVTNKVSVPVSVTPMADGKIRITGTAALTMTDFKIDPPAPKIALGIIKTGDDVKIIFDWQVAQRKKS